jgi:hypothetical protein
MQGVFRRKIFCLWEPVGRNPGGFSQLINVYSLIIGAIKVEPLKCGIFASCNSLHLAAELGRPHLVRLFLESGFPADGFGVDKSRVAVNPLFHAIFGRSSWFEHDPIGDILRGCGSAVPGKLVLYPRPPLSLATLACICLLIRAGASCYHLPEPLPEWFNALFDWLKKTKGNQKKSEI